MRRYYWEKIRRKLMGFPRFIAAGLAALVLTVSLCPMVITHDIVTVTDDTGATSRTLMTTSKDSEEIIQMAGLSTSPYDKVIYTAHYNENAASVLIRRAFPVSVKADGWMNRTEVVDGTVADLLKHFKITLKGDDYVVPPLDTPLRRDLHAEVHRVTYGTDTVREEVAPEAVTAYVDNLLKEDPEAQFRESNGGIYDVTYKRTLVDGILKESEITELAPVITPRAAGSTAFEAGVPCSSTTYDDVEMGPDGLPTKYTRVIKGAVTTAYSSSGGRGASGLGLYCGTVAVNPNVIPYGTRLFITSADQSFVYGFAIATDTGTALMSGHVDIDLYFETNGECLRFGKRALDVYIID